MYTALERGRTYYLGLEDEARPFKYLRREFPDDHPAVFVFLDEDTGELLSLSLHQLTDLESKGALRYGGLQSL